MLLKPAPATMWKCSLRGRGFTDSARRWSTPQRCSRPILSSSPRSRDWAAGRVVLDMAPTDTLRIGITCYPSVGGSGILATALGKDLARRGHDVHFICYERPFRLRVDGPRLHFHRVMVNDYGPFKYPVYTLPLSVRMAEVSRDQRLDVLHVHYAVPHATAESSPVQCFRGNNSLAWSRHCTARTRRCLDMIQATPRPSGTP